MIRKHPPGRWALRYTSWEKGAWEGLEQRDIDDWMEYFNTTNSYRLRRVSPSWMVYEYTGGCFVEDRFFLVFHRRF